MEALFQPELNGRPVVVLSNNDGCVVSRSQEAKDLGIEMGVPVFQIKELIRKHQVAVRSSNYALYGDLSARYTSVLRDFTPFLEVYSIDESFLDLSGQPALVNYGRKIKDTVFQYLGLPVCVGIGRTKTLAKLANRIAKKAPAHGGVFLMPDNSDNILCEMSVKNIWGIARAITRRLGGLGITTILELKQADPKMIRSYFNVTMEKTVIELNGVQCFDFVLRQPDKKAVMVSRSFGRKISRYADLRQAVAAYAVRAAEKIRTQELAAQKITVFIMTGHWEHSGPRYSNSFSYTFPEATFYTSVLEKAAARALKEIYRPGFAYCKAGVLLEGLVKIGATQTDLFHRPAHEKNLKLMRCMDAINRDWGRDTIRPAAIAGCRSWAMQQVRRSPRYTTRWDELRKVK